MLIRFALGSVAHAMSERREEEGRTMEGLVNDVRAAVRRLRRAPGLVAVTVTVLGLGIGANTALFGALDAALLSAPAYPEPDRIVLVDLLLESRAGEPADTMPWSYPKFEAARAGFRSLETFAGYFPSTVSLTGEGSATRVRVEYVTPGYFDIVGVRPATGRLFTAAEEAPAVAPVAVLSHAFWTTRFGADPNVLGRVVRLGGAPIEVVGVAPEGFAGLTGNAELWVPVAGIAAISGPRRLERVWAHWMRGVARLSPDATLATAREEAAAVGRSLTEQFPDSDGGGAHDVALVPLRQARVVPTARVAVGAVAGAAVLFLLIACGNVAGLLVARANARRGDLAVRAALGAGRSRLAREQLVESLLLTAAGGAAGVVLALLGERFVVTAARQALETSAARGLQYLDPDTLGVGPEALAVGLGVTLATGIVFGLLPAWGATRADAASRLRSAATVGRRRSGGVARRLLVSAQLTATVVLLAAAGVMATSFDRLASVDPGFANEAVLTLAYDRGPGATDEAHHLFVRETLDRLAALPGVRSAAAATCAPLGGRCEIVGLAQVDDGPRRDYSEMSGVLSYTVSDGYFETIGTPVVEGRIFAPGDEASYPVVVLNRTAADELFPGVSPLGHRLAITHALTEERMAAVVGVVGDVRYGDLEESPMPAVYLSERQVAMPYGTLLVHTVGDPYDALSAVRDEVARVDVDLPLFGVSSLEERTIAATARTRIVLTLLLAFALSGLLIGAVGLYGVVAQSVQRRTSEVGLRIALGADRARVVRLVVAGPAALAAVSATVGVLAAGRLTRYLDRLLYGTEAVDPSVLAGAGLLLMAVALLAAWLPARRAAGIAPTEALRAE